MAIDYIILFNYIINEKLKFTLPFKSICVSTFSSLILIITVNSFDIIHANTKKRKTFKFLILKKLKMN